MFPKRQTYLNDEIRGDIIAIFKVTHGLPEFPMSSTFAHPTHNEVGRHAYKFHQQWCCTRRHQFAFTIRAVLFCNNLQAEVVNASSVNLSIHSGSPTFAKRPFIRKKLVFTHQYNMVHCLCITISLILPVIVMFTAKPFGACYSSSTVLRSFQFTVMTVVHSVVLMAVT